MRRASILKKALNINIVKNVKVDKQGILNETYEIGAYEEEGYKKRHCSIENKPDIDAEKKCSVDVREGRQRGNRLEKFSQLEQTEIIKKLSDNTFNALIEKLIKEEEKY